MIHLELILCTVWGRAWCSFYPLAPLVEVIISTPPPPMAIVMVPLWQFSFLSICGLFLEFVILTLLSPPIPEYFITSLWGTPVNLGFSTQFFGSFPLHAALIPAVCRNCAGPCGVQWEDAASTRSYPCDLCDQTRKKQRSPSLEREGVAVSTPFTNNADSSTHSGTQVKSEFFCRKNVTVVYNALVSPHQIHLRTSNLRRGCFSGVISEPE